MCDVQAATPWIAIDHWMLEVNKQANAGLQKTYCIHPDAANEAWYVILSSRTQPTELPSDSVDELVRAWLAICQVTGLSPSLSHCHSPLFLSCLYFLLFSMTLTMFKV